MNTIVKASKPYTYKSLKNDLTFLKYLYNNLEIGSIGKSTLGEDIKYIKLGNGSNKIMINAAHHANEWCTSLVIMMFIEKLLQLNSEQTIYKGYDIREIWEKTSLFFVPMVNPDGVSLSIGEPDAINNSKYRYIWGSYINSLYKWKANIRGVDLKLQYPKYWENTKKTTVGVAAHGDPKTTKPRTK